MTSLNDYIQQQFETDASFADLLDESRAELELALQFARLREALGLTQREVAERAGIAQSAVARYEKAGRTPSVLALWRFAEALDAEIVLGPGRSVSVMPRREQDEHSAEQVNGVSQRSHSSDAIVSG